MTLRPQLRCVIMGLFLLGALSWSATAQAATMITDSIDYISPTTWTEAGSPYLLSNNVSLHFDKAAPLTIEPGVIIKFGEGSRIDTLGDVHAVGTAEKPIIFTSLKNDSVGGDSNGDGGSSLPTASDNWVVYIGDWSETASTIVTFDHVQLSYSYRGIIIEQAESSITNIHMDSVTQGLYFYLGTIKIDQLTARNVARAAVTLDTVEADGYRLVMRDAPGRGIEAYDSTYTLSDVLCENLAQSCLYSSGGQAHVTHVLAKDFASRNSPPALSFFATPFTLSEVSIINVGERKALGVYNAVGTIERATFNGGLRDGIEVLRFGRTARAALTLTEVDIANFAQAGLYSNAASVYLNAVVIAFNRVGIESYLSSGQDVFAVEGSIIAENTLAGIHDYSAAPLTVTAYHNWWGDVTGPYAATLNPTGLGNTVSGQVLFTPWLQAPPLVVEEEDVIDPLLRQYLPVLYMHPDETYFPMNVEAFVEGSAIWDDRGLLSDQLLVPAGPGNAATLEYVATTTDTSDWYIQFSGTEAKEFDLVAAQTRYQNLVSEGLATTTVYAHIMEDSYVDDAGVEHAFIVLQYWYFYAMNNWGETGGFNNHEGDWESVFVFLDKVTQEPKYVAFSAHHNDGDPRFNPIQYGSVRREWEEVEKSEYRPTSFVSQGSHAMYASKNDEGDGYVVPIGPINYIDRVSADGKTLSDFEVNTINYNEIFYKYQGKWGVDRILPGEDGPQGPNFIAVSGIQRFHNPITWAGVNTVDVRTIIEPERNFSFNLTGVTMQFTELLQAGERLSAELFREVISFGINVNQINLLPKFWEFGTSLENDTFSVVVTLSYAEDELTLLGVQESDLQAYYFNPITNAWNALPSQVDFNSNTVTFTTNHFSRYALGARQFVSVSRENVDMTIRPGRFDQMLDTRAYVITLTNKSPETLSGFFRLLVSDIEPGVTLLDSDGVTSDGVQYIDIGLVTAIGTHERKEIEIRFSLPVSLRPNSKANPKAQKLNSDTKSVVFDIDFLNSK